MGARTAFRRHPRAWTTALVLGALALAFGLYWFAPWNLFVDKHVNEAVPTASLPPQPPSPDPSEPAADVAVLARGSFSGLEHATSGNALVIRLDDGSRFLRLEDLDTSNGPDLRVYLTDQPLSEDWHVWDDGRFVDLGALKGNVGDQNYAISPDVRLEDYRTAVIWCRRFKVGFGVAPTEVPD